MRNRCLSRGTFALALLPLVLCGCGTGRADEFETEAVPTQAPPGPAVLPAAAPAPLPAPTQAPPPAALEPLTAEQIALVMQTATSDPAVAAGIRQGRVRRVVVRAATTGTPGGRPAGSVAFLFDAPVRPAAIPWEALCDIAGQTDQWRGVAARVVLANREIAASPIWLTGVNCVGVTVDM